MILSCDGWSVLFQFEKEEHIHSIDIGNEGSAFIEVLVGHSTSIKDQDYEVHITYFLYVCAFAV